jgi:hypothetical protein
LELSEERGGFPSFDKLLWRENGDCDCELAFLQCVQEEQLNESEFYFQFDFQGGFALPDRVVADWQFSFIRHCDWFLG